MATPVHKVVCVEISKGNVAKRKIMNRIRKGDSSDVVNYLPSLLEIALPRLLPVPDFQSFLNGFLNGLRISPTRIL